MSVTPATGLERRHLGPRRGLRAEHGRTAERQDRAMRERGGRRNAAGRGRSRDRLPDLRRRRAVAERRRRRRLRGRADRDRDRQPLVPRVATDTVSDQDRRVDEPTDAPEPGRLVVRRRSRAERARHHDRTDTRRQPGRYRQDAARPRRGFDDAGIHCPGLGHDPGGRDLGRHGVLADGAVDIALDPLPLGSHSLVAQFTGDGSFAASTSSARTMEITKADNISVGDSSVMEGPAGRFTSVAFPVVLSHTSVTDAVDGRRRHRERVRSRLPRRPAASSGAC